MPHRYILLVEDNPDDAFLASRIIGKVCQEKILLARDGEEASELLQKLVREGNCGDVRLVLLDLKLPKISGLELLQQIRNSDKLCTLPVVVLTSSDNETDQERCRGLGVVDYVYKPMTAERLQSVLQRIEGS